jgi:hypothetical protein
MDIKIKDDEVTVVYENEKFIATATATLTWEFPVSITYPKDLETISLNAKQQQE